MNIVFTFIIPWFVLGLCPSQPTQGELSIIWSRRTLIQLLEDNCRREEWRPPYQLNLRPYICDDSKGNASSISHLSEKNGHQEELNPSHVNQNEGGVESSDIPIVSDGSNRNLPDEDNLVDVLATNELKDDSMPSFQEWKKQKLSEATIKDEEGRLGSVNLEPSQSNQNQHHHHHHPPNQPVQGKVPVANLKGSAKRVRNYASYECGAKVIAANPEAEGTSRILNEMMDEYLLNPCKAYIWFVIELCESLQPLALELANYELFSSTPQDFIVYGSDNYPARDWTNLGSFTAMDVRTIQRFELQSQSRFLKYIKVEMNSHHGYEHYCPLSVIRIFGTSMVEEFDAIESGGEEKKFDYAAENEGAAVDSVSSSSPPPPSSLEEPSSISEEKTASNLIGTAREAVMNMVRKAAIALSKFPSQETDSTKSELDPLVAPKTGDVLQLSLSSLKLMPWLEKRLKRCKDCGLIDDNASSSSSSRSCNNSTPNQKLCDYIKSLLGLKTYAILCEEVNKEPLLRFRCPLISYFLNATTGGEFNELTLRENLVPSYHVTKVLPDNQQTSFNTNAQEMSQQRPGSSIDYPAAKTHSFVVETVSPTSVIDGSSLSSITSVLIEPNKNGSGGSLQSGDLVTDLVTNTTTPDELNTTSNLADQLIDTNTGNNKAPEKTQPSLSTPSSPSSTTTPSPPPASSASPLSPSSTSSPSSSTSSPSTASMPAITPPPPSPSNNANWVPLSASQAKESVFIRMSNKIRALEVNLSLSSQYLEELSQRYRKNMDEMQRAFNRTITKLNETARVAAEKDDKQQEMLENLEARLALVEDSVSLLVVEKETMHWHFIEVHIILLVIEIIIMVSIMSLCVKRATARLEEKYRSLPNSGLINSTHDKRGPHGPLKRPNSCPETFNVSPAKNKRIEEDLIIVQPSFPLFSGMNTVKNKKRRKKKNGSLDEVGGDYDENRIHSKSSEDLTAVVAPSKTSKDFLGRLNLKASSCYKFDTDSTFTEFRGVKPDSCDNIARKAGGKVLSKSNSSSSSGISSLSGSNNRVLKEKQVNRNFNCNQGDKNSLKSYSSNSASPTKSIFSWKKLLKIEKK